ncbi:MAG TPA: MoaD/ThiS family protein [Ktedonobacterales bacterium]|jgi:sulfur carrier protein ThiS
MVKLTVPASLAGTLPGEEQSGRSSRRSVTLTPGSWQQVSQEIQERFPLLAERIFTETAGLTRGFVLVVNGQVIQSEYTSLEFGNEDELFILPALAGG